MTEDRTPAQDLAAERALLGALMLGSRHVDTDDIASRVQARDFYNPHHEAIWDAILSAHRDGMAVDPIVVAERLGPQALHRAGGAPYLHTLTSEVPLAGHAPHYAERVLGMALRRRLQEAALQVQQRAADAHDPLQAAEDAKALVEAAAGSATTAEGGASLGDAMAEAIDWLETTQQGAETPWADVNDRTNGMLNGSMITVAARPGHGKSLVAKDAALHTAMQGKAVHVATLEMTRNEYMARILCGLAGADLGRMLRRQLSDGEWERVAHASQQARDLPLYLDDRPRQSMAQIRAAARRTQRRHGNLGLVAIDYAQLVQPANPGNPSREQQVAQISRDTKLLAKELDCPVMLLAQLNRNNTNRTDPKPVVSDLRESGSLEQDSDQVWLLHRPDQYGDEERLGEVDLIVGKNRNGPAPVAVPLAFLGHRARIASLV